MSGVSEWRAQRHDRKIKAEESKLSTELAAFDILIKELGSLETTLEVKNEVLKDLQAISLKKINLSKEMTVLPEYLAQVLETGSGADSSEEIQKSEQKVRTITSQLDSDGLAGIEENLGIIQNEITVSTGKITDIES